MNKRWFPALFSIVMLAVSAATPAFAQEQRFTALRPGQVVTFEQEIPINLVFIGYNDRQFNREALQQQLPATYEPVVRYPRLYGASSRDVGLKYTFDYKIVDANSRFEDDFFKHLTDIGRRGEPTTFQQQYNDQKRNVLNIRGPVLYIDAPSTEQWLETHGRGRLGIDNDRAYTIYFINWYGRRDFRFHVYTKTDQPDPDTGVNFGQVYDYLKMIAWGGSHGRTWFYDLSAGPEAWTSNWNVDTPDLDGDKVEDYRMPPIWEYRRGGYRAPSALGSDLGRVTRFVGINLLFTSSPLYDPLVAAPGPGGKRVVHIELFEDDPATIGAKFIDTGFIRRELRRLQPYYAWDVNLDVNQRLDTGAQRAFRIFAGLIDPGPNDCATEFGTPFAALFCYFDANLDRYVPRYGSNDYVGEVFAFNTTDRRMGDEFGLLGYADDNWRDGTQTYIFEFNYPAVRTAGYGFSTTTVHEFGHHIGMSHPHDGYDAELDIDYGPVNEYFFAWSGDESDTVMHYLSLSNGFSHFDRDNMYRWEMAGYLNRANLLLDDVLAHPDAEQVRGQLNNAEEDARQALKSFERWNYLGAAARARRAYERVATAAAELGIMEAPQAKLLMPPRSDVPRFVDPVHIPDAPVPFGGK